MKFFHKFFNVFILKNLGVVLAFVAQLLLTNGLGAEGYGKYIFLISLVLMLEIIFRLGSDVSAQKYISIYINEKNNERQKEFILYWLRRILLCSGCGYLLYVGYIELFISSELFGGVGALSVFYSAVPLLSVLGLFAGVIIAQGRSGYALFAQNIVRQLVLILGALLVLTYNRELIGYNYFLILFYIGSVVGLFLAGLPVLKILRQKGDFSGRDKAVQSEWSSTSLSMLLYGGLKKASGYFVVVMVASLTAMDQVALFNVVLKLSVLLGLGHQSVILVLNPIIASHFKENKKNEVQKAAAKAVLFSSAVSVVAGLVFIVLGEYILALFGEEFVGGYKALIVMSLITILVSFMGPSTQLLLMSGNHQIVTTLSLWFMPIIVLFTALGALKEGYFGAVVMYGVSQLLFSFALYMKAKTVLCIDASILSYLRVERWKI